MLRAMGDGHVPYVYIIISAYWVIEYCRCLVRYMGRTDRPGALTSRSAVEGGVESVKAL